MASTTKNTVFMTVASIAQKIIAFGYFTFIAREIGVTGTGKYFFALSFTTIFVVFVDLGLTNVFVREAAKAKAQITSYLSTILSLKIGLGLLSYLALVVTTSLLGYDVETRQLVYLSGVTMLFDSLHLTLYGVLRALGDLKYEAISIAGSQGITLILGTLFLLAELPLIFLILAFTIASMVNVVFVWTIVRWKYRISIRPSFSSDIARRLVIIAFPFALAAIFARVYSYIDSILLSALVGVEAVGFYSIPYKITYAFQFIPLALVAALYPKYSEYFVHKREALAPLFARGVKYLLLIAVPIACGISVLAEDIIVFLYTDAYAPSILPLKILIVSLIFSYVSFPIGAFLNACDRQKAQTAIVGGVMVLNIVLNVLLIPHYSIVGASIAALVGNIFLTGIGYMVMQRSIDLPHADIFKTFFQIGVAGGVMSIVLALVHTQMHVLLTIGIGAGVYGFMVLFLRVVTVSDIKDGYLLLRGGSSS